MTGYGSPAQPSPAMSEERRGQLLGFAAGGLGVLSFIWGFLDWYTGQGDDGAGGYSVLSGAAGATIGLSLTAGLIAAGLAFEKRAQTVAPAAMAVASLLVVLGVMLGKSSGGFEVDASIGLILQLITALLQAAALIYAWLSAIGRIPAPKPKQAAPPPQQQWGQQQTYQQQPQHQQPQQGYQPQPPPGGYQPPAGYQPPPQQPGYQQPTQHIPTQQPPQGPPPPPPGALPPPPSGYQQG